MSTESVKALTADEYYALAYNRNISRGNAFVKEWGPVTYEVGAVYQFDHEPIAKWTFVSIDEKGSTIFTRNSDGGILTMTKYGSRPVKL